MEETRRLAAFIASTRLADIPSAVVERARIFLLDNLAAGFACAANPWTNMVADLAREQGNSSGPCSLFGRSWTTSSSYAALVNGVAVGGFEGDNVHRAASSHPGAAVFPGLLAVTERDHATGAIFLEAMILGYEAVCRIGLAGTRALEDQRGFHGPGTNAPFGSAVAVGKAVGLTDEQLTAALGIAGSHAAGILEFARDGAMTKWLHVARGSQVGLESALLAQKGFTGPSTVLEGEKGFLKVYSPSPKWEFLLQSLGQEWTLLGVMVKAYPVKANFHSTVNAIHKFKQQHPLRPKDLEQVQLSGAASKGGPVRKLLDARFCNREPTSAIGMQYSLPFTAAVAFCRDVADPRTFGEESLWDPEIRELANRIELAEDGRRFGGPGQPVGELTLTIQGKTHTLIFDDRQNSPEKPDTYDEIAEKFRRYSACHLKKAAAEEVIQLVGHIEEIKDMAALARFIRTS